MSNHPNSREVLGYTQSGAATPDQPKPISKADAISLIQSLIRDWYLRDGAGVQESRDQANLIVQIALSETAAPFNSHDWTEDASRENGNYECACTTCGHTFYGHKRRITCRHCVKNAAPQVPEAVEPKKPDQVLPAELASRVAHSKSEYRRITAQGGNVLPPDARCEKVDADRWRALCNLWAASTELRLRQDEEGTWSITQMESVENETFKPLVGATPDDAINAAVDVRGTDHG